MNKEIQQGLLDWFNLESNVPKKSSAIELVCKNLWMQLHGNENLHYAKHRYFYPLLRSGVIEGFTGGKFVIAPTAALFNKNYIALFNVPESFLISSERDSSFNRLPGIAVVKKCPEVMSALKAGSIPLNMFNFSDRLSNLSLSRAVLGWSDAHVIDQEEFDFYNRGWTSGRNIDENGVYRRSAKTYAETLYRVDKENWKRVPHKRDNFDAFNIAVSYSQSKKLQFKSSVKYHRLKQLLSVQDPFFSIVIERLLYFNTVLNPISKHDPAKRDYFVEEKDFSIICRLIGQIPIINE